jgi:uncharacterized protein YndB with AHSA1/START domain
MSTATKNSTALKASYPSDREVRTERVFTASRDRVWRAFTDPKQLAQWWGRGNKVVVERMEVARGGHWRFIEHAPEGLQGFEGRYREVTPMDRIVQTFEWDGMPGHVSVTTMTFEDLGDGRTRITTLSLFHTKEDCDAMIEADMTDGMEQSYTALDALLAKAG